MTRTLLLIRLVLGGLLGLFLVVASPPFLLHVAEAGGPTTTEVLSMLGAGAGFAAGIFFVYDAIRAGRRLRHLGEEPGRSERPAQGKPPDRS